MPHHFTTHGGAADYSSCHIDFCIECHAAACEPSKWLVTRYCPMDEFEQWGQGTYATFNAVMDDFGNLVPVRRPQ